MERGIKWNEVTWYSRLGAIVLFIGIIPALFFYIGTQYELLQQSASSSPMIVTQGTSSNSGTAPAVPALGENLMGAWTDTPPNQRNACKESGSNCVPGENGVTDSRELDFGPLTAGNPANAFNSYLHSRPEYTDCTFSIAHQTISIICPDSSLDETISIISISTSTMMIDEGNNGPPYTEYYKL